MTTRRDLLSSFMAIALTAAARNTSAAASTPLRVGFQKGEPLLIMSKQRRTLENLLNPLGIDVQWIEFQFGPPMLEAMRVGSVDVGAVGDTPPIFAQAAHGDLLYIAAQRSGGQAILVPPGSPLQGLHDLKGQKVALGRGSSAHNLTIAALEKVGLTYNDIKPVYLGPADAGAAFERGAIDAWTIWDPYYAIFENQPGVRTLAKWTDIAVQNSFFMARRSYVEANPQIAANLVAEFGKIAEWARAHRAETAELMAGMTGVPLDAMRRSIDRSPFLVLPMSDELTRSQQDIADRFRKLGLLPIDIKVNDEVWRARA
jgi:sulfonate transport system substrate-binding protein